MLLNVIKYTSRVAHMVSTAIVTGITVANYFFGRVVEEAVLGTDLAPTYKALYGACGMILIFSGLANVHLIKGKRKVMQYKNWLFFLIVKLTLSLVLTPIFDRLLVKMLWTQSEYKDKIEIPLKFWVVVSIYFISTMAKMYRESIAAKLDEDEIEDTLKTLMTSKEFQ